MPSYVVTGAARGLGLEFANQLSADSANVVFAIVRKKGTEAKLTDLGRSNLHVLEADITNVQAPKAAAEAVSKITGGKLDMLINNAALLHGPEETRRLTLDQYPKDGELLVQDITTYFNINVVGIIHTINAFLPLLKAGALKKVVALTSALGDLDFTRQVEFPLFAPYSISKAALNVAVAKFAMKYKPDGLVFLSIWVTPPTAEEMKEMQVLMKDFLEHLPDFKGRATPQESVEMMMKVIDAWTVDDSGATVSHYGKGEKWL